MAANDREHWDERYRSASGVGATIGVPEHFETFAPRFRDAGSALELACGTGGFSVWLATQGVQVAAYDISPVAVAHGNELAAAHGVSDLCRLGTHDFDDGLPPGDPVDLVVCNMFRDASLDAAIVERLRPGGLLAIAALSEVGAGPGRFRVPAGELPAAFAALEVLASGEGDGTAWLVAVK